MAIALVTAWSLALTIFDGTIFEVIVPITSFAVIVGWRVGISVGRDLFEEETLTESKDV